MSKYPERLHATVNGVSTSYPSGRQELIGGWREDDVQTHAREYVRADLYDSLRAQVEAMRADLTDIAESDDIENCLDPERNKRVARAALAKSTGSPDGQQ